MDPSSSERADPAPAVGIDVDSPDAHAPRVTLFARLLALSLLTTVLVGAMLQRPPDVDASPAATTGSPPHHTDAEPIAAASVPGAIDTGFVWPTYDRSTAAAPAVEADVCTPGAGSADADDEDAFARHYAAAGRRARERLLEVLDASPHDRLRVLALVLQRDAEVVAAAAPAAPAGEACGRDAACARRAAEALAERSRLAAAPKTDALARLASASRDPLAYGLAVEACASNMAAVAPACRLISADQWARLDPANAVPWRHVASTAAARRDAAALADAFHRVAHARRDQRVDGSVHELLAASLPADVGTAERVQVLGMAEAALASASAVPDHAAVFEFCSGHAVRDSNRAQTCDALAMQLTASAGTLFDLGVGIRLAEQIGWPEERVEALRLRHDAYSRVQVEAAAEAEPKNCRELAKAAEQGARQARLGEMGALREAVALSGKSIEQLAAEERASRPVRVAEQGARDGESN
ncbi:MAG TPA: hypothetical protein VHM00_08445 [Caldimonas sp.]|jgi:hypothetical protein|nr:hypothetical protein [Caldimonas sp.]HEX2541098.1 hypothetical protein [Caldimonas sp.]